MGDIKWIKLATDIFDNRKIRQIESMPDGDALVVIWLKLLILAGDTNDNGLVYFTKEIPYTDQLLATYFNRPLSTIQFALRTFEEFGMIEIINNIILISNWEKYQSIEGMERVREQTRLRVAKHRAKQKLLEQNDCNVTVTQGNAIDIDIDKEIDIDKDIKEKDKKKTAKRFTPPTVEEVRAYCLERGNAVDPERFVDFYASKGWKVGNQGMKDWKACVRTWEKRSNKVGANGVKISENHDDTLDGII